MPTVTFLPAEITVEVPAGTLIHEAAIKAGIEEMHLPCGAKGTCGRCLVEVERGQAEDIGHKHLETALADSGLVMACQTKVRSDLVVRLKSARDAAMRVVGESHLLIKQQFLPDKAHLTPLYRTETLQVPPASVDEHYSDWQRLVRELCRDNGHVPVRAGLPVLRKLAAALRGDDGLVTVLLQEDDAALQVLDITAGRMPFIAVGLAIDIGTTTIAVQLVSLHDGRVLAIRSAFNAQARRGADIISRIDYAKTPERQSELRHMVLDTVNELIDNMLNHSGVPAEAIRTVFIAANTTMVHLLLGLPPRHIREAPYVPTVNAVPALTAGDVGLVVNPQAVVAFAPGVGSYVGGDITAGLLCTEMLTNRDEVFLFLDIGTNGEIVLGNADWLVTCACSAGPAFEGAGIKCGMRATEGAIEYLEISSDGREVTYDVIGDGKPVGICGSGLICLLGELLVRGIIDQSGRFNDLGTPRLVQRETTRAFVLEWAAETGTGDDLVITEPDIENLMRTKAAIYAACDLILANVGLDWHAVSRVYIAGGFGRYIQVEDAILIGLLPDLPYETFNYIGNSALAGAYIALLSANHRRELTGLAGRMTYIDLSSDPHYMDSYLAAMFLPHTEMGAFPRVAARLRSQASGDRSQEATIGSG
jgi:uncharacterized 2Fe-2S/4Fe-4S cluster protein (DUF4445 family)